MRRMITDDHIEAAVAAARVGPMTQIYTNTNEKTVNYMNLTTPARGPLMNQTDKKTVPVLITTAHRGVFFGYASPDNLCADTIRLEKARVAIYWSIEVHGFMGLAVSGPTQNCRIGPAADIIVHDVTSVVSVTPEAVLAWEAQPWK